MTTPATSGLPSNLQQQLTQALAQKNDVALKQMFQGIVKFETTHPELYRKLPYNLRRYAKNQCVCAVILAEWQRYTQFCNQHGVRAGCFRSALKKLMQ